MQSNQTRRTRRRRRKARLRVQPRFFLFLAALALIIALPVCAVLFLGGSDGQIYTLGYGGYDQSARAYRALLVRQEQCYRSPEDGKVLYSITEGQDAAASEPVLSLYATGYTDQMMQELAQVRESIKTQQNASLQGKILDPELDALEAAVDQQAQALIDVAQGGINNLAQVYLNLCDAMTSRQDYLKRTGVALADPVLTSLYSDETKLLGRIEAWYTTYAAPQAGRVSYQFDGLETVLTVDTVVGLSPEALTRVLNGEKLDVDETILAQMPLYRLVDPNVWYAAIVVEKNDNWQAQQGQSVTFTINGYNTAGVQATVQSILEEGNRKTVVLRMDGDIGSLISKRFVTMQIGERVEGLMAPQSALTSQGGQSGVVLSDGQTFVPVTVRAQDGENCLIWPVQEGALVKGDQILLP